MFKLDPRASLGASPPVGDESDDSISVTSTVSGHDPEQEFGVENILAEHRFEDGNTYYLVEWTGFQLHESTWEPESNLGEGELKAMWEEDKTKHATGELEPFDIQKFYDARDKAIEEKKERHRRRNLKRKKLGLPLTAPVADSSDEEAVEETGIESSASEDIPLSRARNSQRVFKPVSNPRPSSVTPLTTPVVGSTRPRNETQQPSTMGPTKTANRSALFYEAEANSAPTSHWLPGDSQKAEQNVLRDGAITPKTCNSPISHGRPIS